MKGAGSVRKEVTRENSPLNWCDNEDGRAELSSFLIPGTRKKARVMRKPQVLEEQV